MLLRTGSFIGAVAFAVGVSVPAGAVTQWHVEATVPASGGAEFAAASCPSASFCLAAGVRHEAHPPYRLLERWNGTNWAIVNTPGPSSLDVWSQFNGVSCSSASACTAVGYFGGPTSDQPDQPLIDRWNGHTWARQTAAFPPGVHSGLLTSVACAAATSCFATGFGRIERWNGTSWSLQTLPAGASASGGLSCLSTSNCRAVGQQNGHAVVLHWNGIKWSVETLQPVPNRASSLLAVGCASASNCFATGTSSNGTDSRRLVERWNGLQWAIVFTPLATGTTNGEYDAVACRRGGTCILAGFTGSFNGSDSRTLVARWNGSSFLIESTPNRVGSRFAGAACDPVNACIAAGIAWNQFDDAIPLVERNP